MCQAEEDMFLHPALKRVICVSERVKQEIIHHYPRIDADKLTVIYNGIDLQKYKPISAIQKQKLRDQYHYKQQDKIIVFVGSGFERKGLTELLKGLALSPEWQLIVIGKDKKQAQFETLCQHLGIAERVHFMGVQTAMHDWYGLADLLVHPAWYEPFGNVILEAMASGLGVICTEQCGIAELMTPENEGYILKQDHTQPDHNALEEQIAAYLKQCSHPKQLFELGRAARKTAESLPISGMIKQFIALYQDLLK
jgi:UDP-glucose:(heptosyl)LPS alpha-1,3-glucosyltransferase